MPSKYSEVVLLHYEAYSSMKKRNSSEKKRSSRERLKCDGKTIPRKKKKPLNLKLQKKCSAILVITDFG